MIHKIQNEYLSASINSFGAEITHLVDVEKGIEYISPEANKDWENIAPVLFPNTGLVKDGKAVIEGKAYNYLKHGFARESEFEVCSQSKNSITFMLSSNSETRKIFPFEFILFISYILNGHSLEVKTEIINTGTNTMYCSIGFHPGFTCPIDKTEKAEDYVISFPDRVCASKLNLENGLVASRSEHFLNGSSELQIKEKMFDNGSISFVDLNVKSVKLESGKSGRYVKLDFEDYPNLILWAPRNKPISVICMEPWYGQPDHVEGEKDVSQKPYTMEIKSGDRNCLRFAITCN